MDFTPPKWNQGMSDDLKSGIDMERLVSQRFQGLSRTELREAADILGLNFGPNTSERTMRLKLCEKIGTMPPDEASDPAPVSIKRGNGPFDPKPNLTPSGVWGGKRHRVTIFPQTNENTDNAQSYVRLFHECEPRDYPFGVELDLPHPHYESLRRAETGTLKDREVKDSSGNLVRIEHYEVKSPRYPHQYHGVVPGTEDLPTSLKDYWQRQAVKTNNFEGIQRRMLIQIRADLYGPVGPAFYKDLTDQDILASILEFLGIDEFAAAA
jgi:hypothetical protein